MAGENLKNYQSYLYRIAILLIIGIALLFITNRLVAYYDVFVLPITFKPGFLLYGLITQLTFLLVITYAWKFNISVCTGKNISLRASFCQISLLLVGKYIPGKIWGMYARSLNLLSHKISYVESLLGTYIEQLISVHSGLAFGMAAWLLVNQPSLLIPFLVLVLLSIYFSPMLQNRFFSLFSKFQKKDSPADEDMGTVKLTRRSYLELFLLYLLEWIFTGAPLVILYFTLFDTPASPDLVFILMGSAAIAFVAGFFAIFAPGGIGVREAVIVGLVATHLPLADAVILVLAFRIWFTCSDVLAGIAGLVLLEKSAGREPVDAETPG